ncbi:MAG: hypothetical protein LBD11_03475 [Candidatus Peribacteria bacterium]|jgi:hypothetical protein|nr:hypothetical protein [Candidatus Peribacteria bacterium]
MMTDEEIKTNGVGTPTGDRDALEAELSSLIADESSGLSDLAKFNKNLSHKK